MPHAPPSVLACAAAADLADTQSLYLYSTFRNSLDLNDGTYYGHHDNGVFDTAWHADFTFDWQSGSFHLPPQVDILSLTRNGGAASFTANITVTNVPAPTGNPAQDCRVVVVQTIGSWGSMPVNFLGAASASGTGEFRLGDGDYWTAICTLTNQGGGVVLAQFVVP